ncbi:AAA family ATPase [Bacillus horti]|uniref:MoxR-like ATPase n=1 Tax=Caldalkalibacillus horti TaxID=77523 RepID=A0ABT9W4U0_9BACI|nr:MoxR family ATPase [Bacillus horti]MDQ0168254.1 MoxR-like ATPase [Bacillus horti]
MNQVNDKQAKLIKLQENMNQVIVGKKDMIDTLIIAILANGHVLLEDVPGTGKTVMAKTLAKSLEGEFKRIQFTPDVLPSDVTGINFYNPREQQFELRLGPIHTNILLADEINRATPRSQSSLLEAMEERQVTIDGQTIPMPNPFFVIATQNPVESQGTFPLPEAQMDRFLMKLSLGYPELQEEREILQRFRKEQPLATLSSAITVQELQDMQEEVKDVFINEDVETYLLQIVRATREHAQVEVGISPRGTLAIMRAAQAKAYMEQRSFVIPDDIQSLAPKVLAHRLMLSLDAQLHVTEHDVLQEIINEVAVPLEEVGGR